MSAYYDLYETPVPEGEEPKSLHARVCSKGTISGKEFMERVFREEHMPHAMVVGIVQAITTTLGDWLAKGYTVEIEGLGFFSTTLKCTHPVMNKKEVRAESVKMSTVKFRPGIEFKRYVAGKMELERADKRFFPDKPKAMGDMVAREKSMMDFLEANVCITRAEYSRLVHVTARRASRDLQTFIDSCHGRAYIQHGQHRYQEGGQHHPLAAVACNEQVTEAGQQDNQDEQSHIPHVQADQQAGPLGRQHRGDPAS